jgi:hypothetical protein
MEFTLPRNQHRAFAALAEMDESAKTRLLDILASEPLSVELDTLASKTARELGLEESIAEGVLWMIHNMYAARLENDVSAAKFAEQICRTSGPAGLKLSQELLDGVRAFLTKALQIDETVGVVAKGISLLRDRERIFSDCRVLTDFRPIFREALDATPSAAIIVHNLRLTYVENGKTTSIYVGLDASDLKNLKDCLERAQEKEAGLKATVAASIPCVQ